MSKLRKIRNERGLFQTIVADCVGVTPTTLLGWEKLKNIPDNTRFESIGRRLQRAYIGPCGR